MKFSEFTIKNFKGIDEITFNLDGNPNANIFTLVGLNESGKTTILEAMNMFNFGDQDLNHLDIPGGNIKDYNSLIPVNKRGNFNGQITIKVTLQLEESDRDKINTFLFENTLFKQIDPNQDTLTYFRYLNYKDSEYINDETRWSSFYVNLKAQPANYFQLLIDNYLEEVKKVYKFSTTLIPSILYFPNFLFDFPDRIYLESKGEMSSKEKFYTGLIQDILFSLNNETEIKIHLIDRIKSEGQGTKRALQTLILLMEKKVTDTIFEAWDKIFKRQIKNTSVKIDYDVDDNKLAYLEFSIKAEDGIYLINERSLGFKWFFIFLLFTQFRPFRKDAPKNTIFLFDEPASNLHPNAQKQLLQSFENLTQDCKIIYTTHSHHLINPNWLERTFVVRNEGLNLSDPDKFNINQTKISIKSYRDFASTHPYNTAYFQPILDVLDYAPSNLELLPDCVFLEGKNDFYTLKYFAEVILNSEDKISIAPSSGSSSLDSLISLYLGWGKEFLILLDSDNAGRQQRNRYIEKFGILVESRIFTLNDIDIEWCNTEMENLFEENELLNFQRTCYPESVEFNKTQFNRAIQENLIRKEYFDFDFDTICNFESILSFLKTNLSK